MIKRKRTSTAQLADRLTWPSTNPRVPPMGAAGFALLGAALTGRGRARRPRRP